ncbi:unnamed protein product [Ixodes pacificus]
MTWNSHLVFLCNKLRVFSCISGDSRFFASISDLKGNCSCPCIQYSQIWNYCILPLFSSLACEEKNCLQSMVYNLDIPPEANWFSSLQLPSFDAFFLHCVIHRHFWCSEFFHPHAPVREFRNSSMFSIQRCYTCFGGFCRKFYVPNIVHFLPIRYFF